MSEFEFVSIEKFLAFYNNTPNTKVNYKSRLIKFERFLKYVGELNNGNFKDEVYEFTSEFLKNLKTEFNSSGNIDFYDLMNKYYDYLSLESLYPNLNDVKSKMAHIYTVVELLTKNKISIPKGMLDSNLNNKEKAIEPDNKEGLDKSTIIKILNAANDDRFKLYLTFLAGSGWRRVEPLYLTWRDFWYVFDDHPNPLYRAKDNKQFKVFLKGKYTKTHADRNRYITKEVADMLKLWRTKRYGDKRTTVKDSNGKRKHVTTNPIEFSWDHHVFAAKTTSTTKSTNGDFWYRFNKLRNELELNYLDAKGKRKEINFKSLREYGRTQAYNETGDIEFAEYHFGHKTRYKNKGSIKELEQFKQCELKAFTFLDTSVMNDLIEEKSKNMVEMEEKLRKELKQSNENFAKLAFTTWLKDYREGIFNKIKREVRRELDRKSNPDNYFMGGRDITIDVEEQTSEFPKWFEENYGIKLTKDQVEKLQIKEVIMTIPNISEYKNEGIIVDPASPLYKEFVNAN